LKNSKEETDRPLTLIRDCVTRWSSMFKMVERFLKLEKSINKSLLELGQPQLSASHFSKLKIIFDILNPAAAVVTELSKDDITLLSAEVSLKLFIR
jgi:hypothetical protein